MTIRRGAGGVGRGVSAGSGEGVRERENIFERDSGGRERDDLLCSDGGRACSPGGGDGAQSVIVSADSPRSVSPIL